MRLLAYHYRKLWHANSFVFLLQSAGDRAARADFAFTLRLIVDPFLEREHSKA